MCTAFDCFASSNGSILEPGAIVKECGLLAYFAADKDKALIAVCLAKAMLDYRLFLSLVKCVMNHTHAL